MREGGPCVRWRSRHLTRGMAREYSVRGLHGVHAPVPLLGKSTRGREHHGGRDTTREGTSGEEHQGGRDTTREGRDWSSMSRSSHGDLSRKHPSPISVQPCKPWRLLLVLSQAPHAATPACLCGECAEMRYAQLAFGLGRKLWDPWIERKEG